MEYILSAASFGAFFFALLVVGKKNKALHERLLISWLIYQGLFIGLYLLSFQFLFAQEDGFSAFIVSGFLLHGPFLFLYTWSLTSGKKKLMTRDFLHFVPFLLFVAYLSVAFRFPDYAVGISLDHVHTQHAPPVLFVFFLLLTVVSGPIYFLWSMIMMGHYKTRLLENFSATGKINLHWLRLLLPIFGVIWTILISIGVMHHVFHIGSMELCINGLFVCLSAFVFLMGYFGLKQQAVFIVYPTVPLAVESPPDKGEEVKEKYSGVNLTDEEIAAYVTAITQYMEVDKPFLNSDLTLTMLAAELDIPTHHVSRILNEQFDRNFFDFINGYRVEDVKAKLVDPDYSHFSLLGIAYDAGFNSKSAFNRIFKKATGQTPSEYKKLHS